MGKTKRLRKITVHGVLEGELEADIWRYLKLLYGNPERMNFVEEPLKGGTPNSLISMACKKCYSDRSFVWIDEDVDISEETRRLLAKSWGVKNQEIEKLVARPLRDIQQTFNKARKNPILVVSTPICADAFITKICGKSLKYEVFDPNIRDTQILHSKNKWKGMRGGTSVLDYLKTMIDRPLLEARRKEIPELDSLLKIIELGDA